MDRWTWATLSAEFGRAVPLEGESNIALEAGVRLYDGSAATDFDDGTLTLTSHRLLWVVRPAPCQRLLP